MQILRDERKFGPGAFSLSVALMILLLTVAPAAGQHDEKLRELCSAYKESQLARFPQRSTRFGETRYNDRLDDLSPQATEAWRRDLFEMRLKLQKLPAYRLSASDQLTYALLQRRLLDDLTRVNAEPFIHVLEPLNGAHLRLPLLLTYQPLKTRADFETFLARLRQWPKQVSEIIANSRYQQNRGYALPRVLINKTIAELKQQVVGNPADSAFYRKTLEKAGALTPDDRKWLQAELRKVIHTDIVPGYLRLLAYVRDELLPFAREEVGIGSLPEGKAAYTALARMHTTTALSAQAIHNLGMQEVARIRGEMKKLQASLGFAGDFESFLTHMRNDPQYRAKSAEDLLQRYGNFLEQSKAKMPRLFGKLPKTDCVVKAVESFRAASAPMAYYGAAPRGSGRPAYFYVNAYAPQERVLFVLEALTYHEAMPGHHVQIGLAREMENLPWFRRVTSHTAFVEGWALYAERLGEEIDGYQDPLQKFGELNFEMWRACRLVVDTGMHVMGWSRRQAVEFMMANIALPRLDVENEVDRYIAWPGQALAYKIGELKILEIRHKAEKKLGDKFDLRAFHDYMLQEGSLPLDVLETRMNQWITDQTAGKH